ncbi:MAG: redoxin domain-containing protein [Actinomycetota bacterium]
MNRLAAAARRHPGLSFVAVPCTVLVLALLALWPTPHPTHNLARTAGADVAVVAQNRPAPDFSRPLLSGAGDVTLRQMHGNVLVVNFWASWCAACRNEVPQLAALARQQRDVVFLGVDEQDTRSAGQAFIRRFRPGYRSVSDPGGSLLRAFRSIGVPSTFIVDRNGQIRYQALGTVSAAALSHAVAQLAH